MINYPASGGRCQGGDSFAVHFSFGVSSLENPHPLGLPLQKPQNRRFLEREMPTKGVKGTPSPFSGFGENGEGAGG
jgi:hypothetical protein